MTVGGIGAIVGGWPSQAHGGGDNCHVIGLGTWSEHTCVHTSVARRFRRRRRSKARHNIYRQAAQHVTEQKVVLTFGQWLFAEPGLARQDIRP